MNREVFIFVSQDDLDNFDSSDEQLTSAMKKVLDIQAVDRITIRANNTTGKVLHLKISKPFGFFVSVPKQFIK
jgi:hypothetical protein